jgi:hypothetical protein
MAINRKMQNLLSGVMPKRSNSGGTVGLLPIMYVFETDGAATESESVVVGRAIRVVDAHAVLKGAGTTSDTYQVFNGSNAISDAVSIASAGDKDVVRIGEIDDAYHEIDAGGTLKVTATDGGGTDVPAMIVYVLAFATA